LNIGRERPERTRLVSSHGTIKSTTIEPNMAITPPSLELMNRMSKVMARRIA
jgi:hypothetical protein